MPVYYKHKLVHIHIPKTAGTPIEELFHDLGDVVWGAESWFGQHIHHGRWYEYQHLSMEELRRFAGSHFPGFTSFAVVRDPFTRLISDFRWRAWIQKAHPKSSTEFFDSFETFLNSIPDDINGGWPQLIKGVGQKRANFLIHVRPQSQFVLDDSGNCLVDVILRYESLPRDLASLLEPLGLRTNKIRLPAIHDPGEYFSDEQIQRIEAIYSADFALASLANERVRTDPYPTAP
jgi:hypothetical protein